MSTSHCWCGISTSVPGSTKDFLYRRLMLVLIIYCLEVDSTSPPPQCGFTFVCALAPAKVGCITNSASCSSSHLGTICIYKMVNSCSPDSVLILCTPLFKQIKLTKLYPRKQRWQSCTLSRRWEVLQEVKSKDGGAEKDLLGKLVRDFGVAWGITQSNHLIMF